MPKSVALGGVIVLALAACLLCGFLAASYVLTGTLALQRGDLLVLGALAALSLLLQQRHNRAVAARAEAK